MNEVKLSKVRLFNPPQDDVACVGIEERSFRGGRKDVSLYLIKPDGVKLSNVCNLFVDTNGKLSLELDYCNGDLCNVDEKHRIKVVKLDD